MMDTLSLQDALSWGILDEDSLRQQIEMKRKEVALQHHPYKISELPNGRWQTYVRDEATGKLKQVKAASYDKMLSKLYSTYKAIVASNTLTLTKLYEKWLAYRKETVANPNTVLRDEQHYKRYFEGQDFFEKDVTQIHRPELKAFCCSVIRGETMNDRTRGKKKEGPMSRKEWGNVKAILNGMFIYAIENEWIQINPLNNMTFDRGLFRPVTHRDKTTQVFNTEEEAEFKAWCLERYDETKDTAYMLPVLNFHLGLRIGEAVTLKWSDWRDNRYLDIQRTEFKNRGSYEISVADHTKTFKPRTVLLSKTAVSILTRLKADTQSEEWIFTRKGERLTERQANYVFEKYSGAKGKKTKFSHKVRKTCGSNMRKAGFTSKQCADYLGNSVRVFEEHYEYDTETDQEFLARLDAMTA